MQPETRFDITKLLRPDLPPAAAKWTGLSEFYFIGGNNDAGAVPTQGLIDAATRVLSREGRTLANYGLESGPMGYRPLREFIVKKLARDAGIHCEVDEVLITSGSLHGLDLVNGVFIAPGDTVVIEKMTYGGTITRLNRLKAKIIGVDVDRDGMSMTKLREALQQLATTGVKPKFIYTIPTVQNPTATVMTEARRSELITLSHEFGVPIFEDDCYADLSWDGSRPPAIRGMRGGEDVIYIGSFSKTIAPALRVGYLVARWPLMGHILSIKNDGGTGALEQMVLAEYCSEHFESHVRELRGVLRAKAEALMNALRASFADSVEFDDPAGGIFLWVKFPQNVDTSRLAQVALQAGIAINPGAEWMTDAVEGKKRMRLCFAQPSEQKIHQGVAKLAEVCHREFGVPTRSALAHR